MADKVRTEQELLNLYANNNTGEIDAQDLRDFVVTHFSHVEDDENPHSVTAAQVGALVSLDGVSNAGGNVDLVAGTGISITPNDGNNSITITNTTSNTDQSVKVSNNDSTSGFLNSKLVAGTNITLTENNDGGNETLTIAATGGGEGGASSINELSDVDISSVADGEVLVYNSGDWINQTFAEADIATDTELQSHLADTDNPHSVTATQISAIVSLDGVSNPGGNIDLVAGSGINIAPSDGSKSITITNTSLNTDQTVKVSFNDTTAGFLNGKLVAGNNITFTENGDGENETLTIDAAGVTDIGDLADVTISSVSNNELLVHSNGDWINQTFEEANIATDTDLQDHISNINNPHDVTAFQVGAVVSINNVSNAGGNINLLAGNGISITPDDANNNITIELTGEGPSEIAINGLSDVTITNVANGEILLYNNGDWINQTFAEADIAADTDLQSHESDTDNPHMVTASQVGALVSVNSVANAGGNIDLVAGTGISITPNDGSNTITIESTVIGGEISEIALDQITDVTITTVTNGEILVYNNGDWINQTLAEADVATDTDFQSHASDTDNPHMVTATQVGAITSIDGVSNAGGNIDLVAGSGISITPDDGSNTITIESTVVGVSEIAMDGITDVIITDVTNNEILTYNNGDWINQTFAEADVATNTDLQSHTSNTNNPHSVTATQVGAITSIDGVSNAGGNIDLVAGTGISITADDESNTITIESTVVGGEISEIALDQITDVTITTVTNGEILVHNNGDWINQTLAETDIATSTDLQSHISNTNNPHSVTASQVGALVSVNNVANAGGNIDLVAGTGISITPDDGSNTITIESTGGGISEVSINDITDIVITDAVNDELLVYSGGNWINQNISEIDIAADTDLQNHISDISNPHSVTAAQVGALVSVNSVANSGGNIDLVAGEGISITPDDGNNTITIDTDMVLNEIKDVVITDIGEMPSSDWIYKKILTDDNTTSLTDYAVQVSLTTENFDFSHAKSDGADLRFWDATDEVLLPYWIKSYDSVDKTAEIWVRVRDASHQIEMYYGNSSALSTSDGEEVFLLFNDYSQGSAGDKPSGYARIKSGSGGSIDENNTGILSTAEGLPGQAINWIETESVITEATSNKGSSRVPTQQNSFYAAGRWWVLFGPYPDDQAGNTPPLKYTSTLDGATWEAGISTETNIQSIDAAWSLWYEPSDNTVHVIASEGNETSIWFGIKYRKGTPNSDGTITWAAAWQTVVSESAGKVYQDPTVCVASDGHVWIGAKGGTEDSTTTGNAVVLRNGNTDGTWSTDFEKELTTSNDCRMALVMPLSDDGAIFVATYRFNVDTESTGYVVETDETVTSEGDITDGLVETDDPTSTGGGNVGRVQILTDNANGIHLVYRNTTNEVRYKHRSAAGVWSSEIVLAKSFTERKVSHPVLCRNGNDLVVFWTDANQDSEDINFDTIYIVQRINGEWTKPHRLLAENLTSNEEHIVAAFETVNGKAGFTTLREDLSVVFRQVDLTAGLENSISQSLRILKNDTSTTSQELQLNCRTPDVVAGTIVEWDFLVSSISSNNDGDNNDNVGLCVLVSEGAVSGPAVLVYGNNGSGSPCVGYASGGHNKLNQISLDTWYKAGILVNAGDTFDFYFEGSVIANDAGYLGDNPSDLTYIRHLVSSRHTGNFYIDNLRVRPRATTEPNMSVGEEVENKSNRELFVYESGNWINQTFTEADVATNTDLQDHISNISNPHSVTASQVGALVSVNSVANAGGNIDLVAGEGISITPDDESNTITIESTGSGISEIAVNDITDITITSVTNGELLIYDNGNWINQTFAEADVATNTDLQDHISNISNPHSVTASQVGALVSVNSVANAGGNIDLVAGTGISITTDDGSNTITIDSTVIGVSEIAIDDLTNVSITDVANGELLIYDNGDWINQTFEESDVATSTDLQDHISNISNPHSVTASQVGALVSVNSVANAGGNIDLVAGTGISITPNDGSNTITIESTVVGGEISEIALDQITDVTITSAADGELLVYNAGEWINQNISEINIAADTDLQNHISDISNPHSVTASQIGALVSVNSVANAGGNIDLVAGTGISITSDDGSNSITIDTGLALNEITDVTITNISEMPSSDWTYKKILTDDNTTSLTDHAVQILLTTENFDFLHAKSDGADLRFWDATDEVPLPYWIKSYDSVAETAEIWVRVLDVSHQLEMYYGNADAESRSNGHTVFPVFSNFNEGDVGDVPPDMERAISGTGYTIDEDNTIHLVDSPALSSEYYSVSQTTTITTGSGSDAYTQARVPHQRQCFYAVGRYWLFWADYSDGGTTVRPFQFRSSLDGETWSNDTSLGTIPYVDAQWGIKYDSLRNKIHVWRMIQSSETGQGDIFHDGLMWRQGVPNSDGTITWDTANWQPVNAVGNANGDPSIEIGTDGHVWFSWDNGSVTGQGDAQVVRNANTDGTWSTDPNFPVVLTDEDSEDTPIISALNDGKMYAVVYRWDSDIQAVGYVIDVDGSVTSEGNITAIAVETDSGTAAKVGRIDAVGRNGEVHVTYQTSAQQIRYLKRDTSGNWSNEIILGYSWTVGNNVSSPRISFDSEGGVHVIWDEAIGDYIYHSRIVSGLAGDARRILLAAKLGTQLEGTYGHMMPAEECAENGDLQIVWLDSSFGLRHSILSSTPTNVTQSLKLIKSTSNTSNHSLRATRLVPDLRTGYLWEFDFYLVSMSQNNGGTNNDHLKPFALSNSSLEEGPFILIYGDPVSTGGDDSLGYFDGSHNKGIASITRNQWYNIGVRITDTAKYDLLLDDNVIDSDISFRNAITPDRFLIRADNVFQGEFYIDNLRVRKWAATEPDISVGEEVENKSNRELFVYEGGNWINQTFAEADVATDTNLQNHISNTSNPHSVTAAQVGALASVNSVSNAGGNIDLVAGDGISITPDDGSNTITIELTGSEISEILEDTSPQLGGNLDTNEFTITTISNRNLVLEPNGTGAFVASSSGNTRGNYSVDLQRDRDNVAEVASGANATISGGANNQASASYTTIPGGFGAKASHYGEFTLASGSFAATGDAQTSVLVARLATSDATETELTLDGSSPSGTNRLTLSDQDTWVFSILLSARCVSGSNANKSAGFKFEGVIQRTDTTTSIIGSLIKTIITREVADWDATVEADDTNECLVIKVTGEASQTIRWVATIYLSGVNG